MPEDIKSRILKERGLVKVKEHKPRRQRDTFGKFAPLPRITIANKRKTALMKYLEQKYGVAMEQVLISGSLSIVAKKLGNEIDTSTLSRWIKRFKLRYTATNLPDCNGCPYWELACNGGICKILVDLEDYDLMLLKRDQILKGGVTNEGD